MKKRQSERIREVYFLRRQNPLVEEDLAAGEGDVEEKVSIGQDLIFAEGNQPIRHCRVFPKSPNEEERK